jgi:hypothetical protein
MEAATQETERAINKARGRKETDGQEKVISTKPIRESVTELCQLKVKADAARDRLNVAVKAVAEKSGLLSSVVRKFVNARAGENFEEEKRKVEQLGLVFDEVSNQ